MEQQRGAAPGAVSKQIKNGSCGKSVVVLKRSDVIIRNQNVYMPNTIEMAQLKKPEKGQFRRQVQIDSAMTAKHIENLLKECFPCLLGQRFYCAAAVDNRTRLDFHGERRIWNGSFIKRTVKGNSALYIFAEESGHPPSFGSHITEHSAFTWSLLGQCVIQKSGDSGQPVGMGLLESEIQGPSITSCMSANQASFLLSEMPSSPQEKNPLNGRLNPGTHNMTSYLSPNNASQMFSTLSDSWCQELEDLPNMRSFGTSSASEVDSGWQDDGDGLPCVQQEQVGLYCIYGTSHTEDGSLTRAADRITISQARSQDCDLDHPESTVQPAQIWTDSNRNSHTEDSSSTTATDRNTILSQDCDLNHSVVELIRPQSGPLKGEYLFVISLSEPLPSRVNSGKAEFCGVATVNLEKLGNQAFLGVVPRCPSPGIVQVNVMTQNGELLGITCFEYFDETTEMLKEIVRNPAKQADFFLKWSEVCKSVSDSSLQTKEQNLLRGLQSLVYTAAQTGAWQFIELIFSTSAGKIVFDSYKDRTPLPEEVARAYGYDDLANYLQDLTTRFSKEPLEFSLKEVHEIDWSELEAAAIAAQTQGCLTEEKSSDDSSENNSDTDYFADVETSIDSSELSRSTSEDDSSEPYSREKTEASAHQSIFSIFKGTFAENGTMEKIRQHIEGVKQKSRVLILEDSHFHFSLPEVVKGLNYTLAFQVATRSKNIPRHLHTANERFLGSRESIIRQPTISFCKLHPHPDVLIESSLVKNNNDHISRTVASKQSNQLNEDIPLEQFGVHRHFPLWVLTSAFRPKRKTLFVYFADRRDALPPNYFFEDEDCELQIRRWKWKRSEKKSVKKKKRNTESKKATSRWREVADGVTCRSSCHLSRIHAGITHINFRISRKASNG